MKLLFISNIAGERISSFSISNIMAAKELGVEFHYAANWSKASKKQIKEEEDKYGITIHHIDFIRNPFNPKNYKAYKQLNLLIKNEKYDVIHCNTPIGGVLGRICARKANISEIIYTVHGFHFYKGAPLINNILYKNIEKYFSKITNTIITINKEDYNNALNFKNINKNLKVFYVPGVGIKRSDIINTENNRSCLLEELHIKDDAFLIISAGELNNNKNQEVVIKTLAEIKNPNIHYLICGIGQNKEMLKIKVEKFGLEKNVHFLGFRNDIVKLMKCSDIFVMPSFREGLSRAVMEAMASGLPVIASEIRGNVDLIEEGKNGYLFNPNDAVKLKEIILSLVNNCKEIDRISKNNIEGSAKYDFNNIKDEIKSIYSGVLINEL